MVKPTHGSNQITGNASGARRTTELFSPEALQHVFLSLKTNRYQQESTEECIDPVGDHVTDLINFNPCFRFDASCRQSSGNSPHNEHNTNTNGVPGFTFSPLFCRRNMRLLKRFYHQRVKKASLMTIPLSVIGFCYEKSPCRSIFSVTLGASTLLFFSLLAAGLALVLLTSHVVFVWSSHEACFLLIQLSTFLFDWKELAKHCPGVLKLLGGFFIRLGNLMDRHVCLRKHFAGREWHQNEFEFVDTLKASSRHTELWNLPPPCVHEAGAQRCLDQRYMARDEWSQATSKHVVAINFCYVMMREEYVRKRARRSTVFHQQSPTPPTEAASTTARNRTCIKYECFPSTLPSADVDDEVATHRHVMSISTSLGGVRGLAANSPSGGIELIRANPDSVRPSDPFRMESFAFPAEGTTGVHTGSVPDTPTHIKSDSDSCKSSVGSVSSAAVADMNWVDISARIGMRVLNSSHIQRVVASEEAAEHLKKITEQFVVSPQENSREAGFSSPAGLQSLRALSNLDKSTTSRMAKKLPKSPCPPVHSMWTSAAAAGASNDEDDSLDSGGCDWKESKSSDLGDAPTAPPRIIRTRQFPSTIPRRQKQTDSKSPLRDIDNANQLAINKMSTDDSGTCEVIRDTILHQEEQSYEVLDSTHLFQFEYNEQCGSFSHGASHLEREIHRREPLAPGVKVAAPLFPHQPGLRRVGHSNYQMATVVSSERVLVDHDKGCLSVTCKIDKSFLRNGEFAELTFRVMDEWSSRYMPKHSKVPIGSCVATSYGIGVVVGWRVEDDCHVVRSLWSRRGACAYLRRTAILHVVEAAIGFDVVTKCGSGKILGCVDGGRTYIVTLQDDGAYKNCVVELRRDEIFACDGAQFCPVIEHIKEACDYQIMLDNYKAIMRYQRFDYDDAIKRFWSDNLDVLWNSFLKAVQEDTEFDAGVDKFMTGVIEFLERLDRPPIETHAPSGNSNYDESASTSFIGEQRDLDEGPSTGVSISIGPSESGAGQDESENVPGLWLVNDFFGGIFQAPARRTASTHAENTQANGQGCGPEILGGTSDSYKRAFSVINTLMRTISMARAASVGKPQFRLALSICREFLLFFRTVIKVQRKNTSQSLLVWRNALDEIVSTFGPIKERFERIFRGIAHRMEQQGRKAKIKVLRFADSILGDEIFLNSLCQGEWKQCLLRIEDSMVKAKIIDEASCAHYRKTVRFIYEHVVLLSSKESGAAERNSKKLQYFAKMIQLLASPKRSLLKLLKSDEVLEIFERILVRVFCREKFASRTLTIYASNFKSMRHLRNLKDLSVSGRLWIPLLDAADEELSYVVSRMPENAKEFMCPLSSIFSLCVAQFHKISAGNSTKDWLDFLLEEDAVRIIHDIDMKMILWLSSFSRDVQEMMTVLPYYPSIDDDILNLMDEVELDKLLKEASEAIDDAERLSSFIREKASTAIERFLSYLPKLSIPVERRDLGEGWLLTCHGEDGKNLTLSDVKVKRENLVCEVMGGDALFFPIFGEDETHKSHPSTRSDVPCASDHTEESILDTIREMIQQCMRQGSWTVGIGGVDKPPTDKNAHAALRGLPVTSVLNCAIDLWRQLEIDDDELLEIAIRDVSYQIQLHQELEEKAQEDGDGESTGSLCLNTSCLVESSMSASASLEEQRSRFNPRIDPTILFLKIKNLKLDLERFCFRIEKGERRTVFDPVFEGMGTVSIHNLSIVLRVECARERIGNVRSADVVAPVLLLQELEVDIENVRLKVHDTGADWLLNQAVKGFSESITTVVESNLKEQIQEQLKSTLEKLNSYFHVNPEILLSLLGITMDDLEEHVVFV